MVFSVTSPSEASRRMSPWTASTICRTAARWGSPSKLASRSAPITPEALAPAPDPSWPSCVLSAALSAPAIRMDAGLSKTASVRTARSKAKPSARATASAQAASESGGAGARWSCPGCGAGAAGMCRASSESMRSAVSGFGSTRSTKPTPSRRDSSSPATFAFKDSSAPKSAASSSLSSVISRTSSILHAAWTHANMIGSGSYSMDERTA
mmetsp:Transcript_127326/g.360279  ORF Transcript_127326/g.360279 Transcript_127326/m.360279 type:complete len:210 (+) Transcript_127326:512-1141(+)